jgi:hypothetical protein
MIPPSVDRSDVNMEEIIMKSSLSRIVAVSLAMWFGFVAAAANAGVVTINSWNGNSASGYSATFGHTNMAGQFSDSYDFSVPPDSSGKGTPNGISLGFGLSGNGLTFSSYNLYQAGLLIASGVIDKSSSYLGFTGGGNGNYTLGLKGSTSSSYCSYDGHISVSPVPEPETYAMMLVGLGLVFVSVRRRKDA